MNIQYFRNFINVIIFLFLFVGCNSKGPLTKENKRVGQEHFIASISSIGYESGKIKIIGSNLQVYQSFILESNNNKVKLNIVNQKTSNSEKIEKLYLEATELATIGLDKALSLVVTDVYGATNNFTVKFTLENGSVTADKLSTMKANDGDVLTFDESKKLWTPKSLTGLSFVGTWDASIGTPPAEGALAAGSYWIVSAPGATNLSDITDWKVGDWAIFNGEEWQRIKNSTEVASFNNRKGAIVPEANDYTWEQINKENSKIGDISDVAPSIPNNGDVLKWNGTQWEAAVDETSNAGTNTNLSNHISDTSNPHNVTKTQVGLGNVDNTSDLNKPISTSTQSALDLKATAAD